MEKSIGREKVIFLTGSYSRDSQKLYESLQQAGYDCIGVSLEDNGFLPDGMVSVYSFFCGDGLLDDGCLEGGADGPVYFDEITVPDGWEITGGPREGYIHNLQEKKGKIIYAEPLHKRLVRQVDWYDSKGRVRLSDHYNRYGMIYARTVYDADGQQISRSWFSALGQVAVLENFVTGNITVEYESTESFFRTKLEFVLYFFEKTGYGQYRIFFNSLALPFFVSNRLRNGRRDDVLFWQEPVGNDIPGNMQMILKGGARASEIMVQREKSYERLLEFGATPDKIHKLGFIYSFKKENHHRYEALICTNSDDLEQCYRIIEAFPQMTFHIAARTKVSPKLLDMEMRKYDNVKVYQLARMETIDYLFDICDYYFDINHGAEIVSAVRSAFLHNHLIFAFEETVHDREYVAGEHIYPAENVDQMIKDVRAVMSDDMVMEEYLTRQHKTALAESPSTYHVLL